MTKKGLQKVLHKLFADPFYKGDIAISYYARVRANVS